VGIVALSEGVTHRHEQAIGWLAAHKVSDIKRCAGLCADYLNSAVLLADRSASYLCKRLGGARCTMKALPARLPSLLKWSVTPLMRTRYCVELGLCRNWAITADTDS
jgi:hypothetical protein